MTVKEQIIEKIQKLPESSLPELYKAIQRIEESSEVNALAKLRHIKIAASSDFSQTAEIYPTVDKQNAE